MRHSCRSNKQDASKAISTQLTRLMKIAAAMDVEADAPLSDDPAADAAEMDADDDELHGGASDGEPRGGASAAARSTWRFNGAEIKFSCRAVVSSVEILRSKVLPDGAQYRGACDRII